jgi:hypothetical protein
VSLLAHTAAQGTSSSVTSSGIDTTGASFIAVAVSSYSVEAAPTLSDSNSNSWTPLTARTNAPIRLQWFYAISPTVGSGHTFSLSGSNSFAALAVQAHSSVAGVFDYEASATGGGTAVESLGSGSLIPQTDDTLAVAAWGFGTAANPTGSFVIDNSFTALGFLANVSGQSFGIGHGYKYLSGGEEVILIPAAGWAGPTTALGASTTFTTAGGGGSPVGSLVGGKLTNGGILVGGRLVGK